MSRWRDRLKQLVLLPLVVVAVGILAYFTFRTTLQIDTLRQQSVLEATLALASSMCAAMPRPPAPIAKPPPKAAPPGPIMPLRLSSSVGRGLPQLPQKREPGSLA
jgi:hypothetical protein